MHPYSSCYLYTCAIVHVCIKVILTVPSLVHYYLLLFSLFQVCAQLHVFLCSSYYLPHQHYEMATQRGLSVQVNNR